MKMAAMAQVLNHRNPTHAADSFMRLSKLRREGILCDLTILVQDQKFKAHKVVMAACSDFFLTAICGGKSTAQVSVSNGANGSHTTIELQYVTARGFIPLLEYAYTSELKVTVTDVIDVLAAASCMQMFHVANACSEFMHSNLLWPQNQSQLSGLPLLPGRRSMMLNGQHMNEHGATSPAHGRSNCLPEAVTNLLQATSVMSGNSATGAPNLCRPPMLIPISSMNPYDVNLQQWADTMAAAGTQSLISRIVNGQSNNPLSSPPSSMSPASPAHGSPALNCSSERQPSSLKSNSVPERRNSSELARSLEGSPIGKEADVSSPREGYIPSPHPDHQSSNHNDMSNNSNNNNNNNNNNSKAALEGKADKPSGSSSNRKSIAIKVETTSDDEMNSHSAESGDGRRQTCPQEDAEDSWQSLQKLYSFQKSDANAPSPSKQQTIGDKINTELLGTTMTPSLLNRIAASTNGMQMALDKYKDGIPKLDNSLSMVSGLNELSVRRALLQQQQQFLAQQQQQHHVPQPPQRNIEQEKLVPELPAVPAGGQYMSVRRRTLQSNVPKPHQCQICGSRFTRFHNLKQHIKLHSGVKPYECDECGKRFTRNYTLRLHKMKHVGLRNFRCGTCDAAFTSLGEFRAHLRITMHSHLSANGNAESPQTQNRGLEPEDLSRGHLPRNAMKFGQFDCSLLNYGSPGSSGGGAAGEGSVGTISPPGNANPSHLSPGIDSPHLSDRSLSGSPQDLSTKRTLSDMEDKTVGENESDYCQSSPKASNNEMQHGEEVNKRKRLNCESPSPYKSANEKEDSCGQNNEPMALVVDTSATENINS